MSNKPQKAFEYDASFKPLTPTLVVAEAIPGTDQRVVIKYYGVVSPGEARREVKYRAEQLAPPPVRQRRERTFEPRVAGVDANGELLLAKRQRRERRGRHDDAYAA